MLKCKVFVLPAMNAGLDGASSINKWLDDNEIMWRNIKRIDQSSCAGGHSTRYSMTTTITIWYEDQDNG